MSPNEALTCFVELLPTNGSSIPDEEWDGFVQSVWNAAVAFVKAYDQQPTLRMSATDRGEHAQQPTPQVSQTQGESPDGQA